MRTSGLSQLFRQSTIQRTRFAAALLVAMATALTACGQSPEVMEAADATSRPLMQAPGITKWAGNPALVKIYVRGWAPAQPQPAVTSDDGGARIPEFVILETLRNTWSAIAKVDFEIVGTRPNGPHVELFLGKVANWWDTGGSANLGSGNHLVEMSVCSKELLGSPYCERKYSLHELIECNVRVIDSVDCTYGWEAFKSVVIHEFGHVLGFNHEHQRPDTPGMVGPEFVACPRCDPQPGWCDAASWEARAADLTNNAYIQGIYLTPSYDKNSVMNYCRDQNDSRSPDSVVETHMDWLSDGDVIGVRAAYGTRPSTTSANRLYLFAEDALWRVTIAGVPTKISGTVNWSGATAMAAINSKLYVIQAGTLHEVDPLNGAAFRVMGDVGAWVGPTAMATIGADLFIIQNDRLYVITNFQNGAHRRVGSRTWAAVKSMTSLHGTLYILNNGLHRVDPRTGSSQLLGIEDWGPSAIMTGLNSTLYAVDGNGLYRVSPATGEYSRLSNTNWNGATAITALNGWLYITQADRLHQAAPNNGNYTVLTSTAWPPPIRMTALR